MKTNENKIEKLISKLCPEGVDFLELGEVANIGTGSSNGNEAIDEGNYPFFVRSKFVKKLNRYEFDEEAIIIPGEGGIGEIFHYVNGKYALHQRAYRINFIDKRVSAKFAYYYLFANFLPYILRVSVDATVKSIRKPMIEHFKIPVPLIAVQEEIVRILDNFTQLEAELEAELEARKKQYEYYREELLTFGDDAKFFRLGEVTSISIGEFVHKNKQDPDAKYPVYNGGTSETGYYKEFNNTGNKILVSARGASAGFVNKIQKPYWAGNSCYTIDILNKDKVDWMFVYYYLKSNQGKLIENQQKGGIPAVSKKQMENFRVPIPPLAEQKRIVAILDKFDALVNDISTGLPAELAARRKQYEYYRSQLLTFPELKKKEYAREQ